ncbi:Neuronal acetylcholine receptor subunit beta-3, partial [Orchesella cincta]
DEQLGKLTLDLITVASWDDEHVKWNPEDYGNLTDLQFASSELWKPDFGVLNNYDESEMDHFGNCLLITSFDSLIWWIPPTKFIVGCATDYYLWPYDKQRCHVWVSSWAHNIEEIDIIVPENHTYVIRFTCIREWKIIFSSVTPTNYSANNDTYFSSVYVTIVVDIQRKWSSHTAAITIVGLGIAAAILVSFWLDPFANERIPLTLVVILINSIYLQYMHKIIPSNGNSVPLAVRFFSDSLVMVTFGLAWTVFIRYIAKTKRISPVPLPAALQTFLNSPAGTILCLNLRPTTKAQIQRKNTENSEDDGDVSELVEEDNNSVQEDWEWLARLVDRLLFIIYLITYTIFIVAFL